MTNSTVENLRNSTADNLEKIAKQVRTSPDPNEIRWTMDFSSCRFSEDAKQRSAKDEITEKLGKKCQSIYVFRLVDEASPDDVWNAFTTARGQGLEDRAYARPHLPQTDVLYVGSSHDTASRLAGHLGWSARKTYAMHIGAWASQLRGGVEICVYKYDGLNAEILQNLEDQLHKELNPILGKRGGK